MIRGTIFDLDGVLLDSMGIWEDLGARYLRRLHIPPEPGLNEVLFPMSMEQGAVYLKARITRFNRARRKSAAALPKC